ncbi:MAG: lytic polysaccharide monooxygenase [Microbacterium sp.]|jgi:predicted carbohydrate-binding protein with CBM5 and CBM33 domain|nr:lytic polysaccharide monooxygenase [Microbacterium sp.]
MRRKWIIAVGIAIGALVGGAAVTAAGAHGWVTDPPSRQAQCAAGATSFDCGSIKYEPQSVEAPKGSMKCSGGNAEYAILDDASKPWPRTKIDSTATLTWNITARHSTSSWEYFVDGVPFAVFDGYNKQPDATVTHTLKNLPAGDHTILARWNVADTVNAFYNCMDVTVGTGGSTNPDPDPTPTPNPGTCTAPAWSASGVYTGGTQVSEAGHTWKASWWTTGEKPGTTGEWGVWKDLGAC